MELLINQFQTAAGSARPEADDRETALASLREFIASGNYTAGDRLPPERELTLRLGMTRAKLRWCLEALERDGIIWRHVGKGTFLAAEGSDNLTEVSRQLTPVQMMQARLTLEPALAREAAMNATQDALLRIISCRELAAKSSDWEDYEARDDQFHRCIAEATGNALLLSLFDRLNRVRRMVAWNTVVRATERPPSNHPSFVEHQLIADQIKARNPTGAQLAMRKHLGSVSARLFGEP